MTTRATEERAEKRKRAASPRAKATGTAGARQVPPPDGTAELVNAILASKLTGPLKRSLVAQFLRLEYGNGDVSEAEADEPESSVRWVYGAIVIVVGIALLTALVFSFILAARGDDIPNVLVGLAAGSLVVLAVLAVNEIVLEWRNRAERPGRSSPGAGARREPRREPPAREPGKGAAGQSG
jgi:hypothetical protein